MRHSRTYAGAASAISLSALLFCATFTGCAHYCVAINLNPGGTIDSGATCTTTTSTGNVTLAFGSSVASASADALSAAPRAPHIFVTLRGIDALPSSMPGDDATAWQPLTSRPVQVDLNAPVGDSCSTAAFGTASIPAGAYSQLRLRVVQNLGATTSASLLENSACGANLINCLIPPDAAAQPLAVDDSGEIVIPSDRIAGGSIRVLPDSHIHLTISLDPRAFVALPAANSLRFVPAFSVADAHCSQAQ
ncbi:MAG TPA: DUF4382 domain-containing protein [Candidatus Acidoferrum sp.]|nr:DUF4382 domain-containing protein [Candidatus Acidoferrum sp.]HXY79115.1 DUF4382 domain-containing protein [Candidatus Bathyarchaeia archaeon]